MIQPKLAKSTNFILVAILAISWVAQACEPGFPGSGIRAQENGGSNYISYGDIGGYLGSYRADAISGRPKFDGERLRPVVGAYHLDPELVNAQLAAMAANGQSIIALPIWFASVPASRDLGRGFSRHFVYSNGGSLQPQQQENFEQVLTQIRRLNFSRLIIRLMPQGGSNPYTWQEFDEEKFTEDLRFIKEMAGIARRALRGSTTTLLVDLGAEQGGARKGQNPEYVKRLWREYCVTFRDCDRSAFFSFNPVPPHIDPRIRNQHAWMTEVGGPFPMVLAVDVYGYGGGLKKRVTEWDVYSQLVDIFLELKKTGQERSAVLILESFYNDRKTSNDIRRFTAEYPVNLMAVVQWPNTRQMYDKFFFKGITNFAALDFPAEYCWYSMKAGSGALQKTQTSPPKQ